MILSDEQMGAAARGSRMVSWSHVELPVGPQPIPAWALGCEVDFADGYGNSPYLKLKTNTKLRSWPNQRFTFNDGLYLAESDDGRGEAFYHGPASMVSNLKRWVPPKDGEPGRHETYSGWATSQSEGFGGSVFNITMDDGREVALRGPWHGPCPDGFVEAAYVDVADKLFRTRNWLNCGGIGGLLLRHDVFIRIFARFAPHLRLVAIHEAKRTRLEPIKPEWDCPKEVHLDRERRAAISAALKRLDEIGGEATKLDGHPPWVLYSMRDEGLVTSLMGGDWRNPTFQITDAGREALKSRPLKQEQGHE